MDISVKLLEEKRSLQIDQTITYKNTSPNELSEIYLMDWANSFSSKTTPLGERFSEDFRRRFFYAGDDSRGETTLSKLVNTKKGTIYTWERPEGFPDVIKVTLSNPLLPGEEEVLNLQYTVRVPDAQFTRFGYDNGNYKLRYWYISPAVYNNEGWQFYSNKNIHDHYTPPAKVDLKVQVPRDYFTHSDLAVNDTPGEQPYNERRFKGDQVVNATLYITRDPDLEKIIAEDFTVTTNLKDGELKAPMRALAIDRILNFLEERLGEYPHESMLITQEEYKIDPVYGLNQLPSFIRPFPDGFQYEMKQLKTITGKYLKNTLLVNPRKEKWLLDGIHIYLLMEYVDKYYPNMKIIGSLSDFFGIRWFHIADKEFNEQYTFLYQNTERLNLQQALSTSQDSLVKYNQTLANPYKAGVGIKYLDSYLQDNAVAQSLKDFYESHRLEISSAADFKRILQSHTDQPTDWFFEEYVDTNKTIDFVISRVRRKEDSLVVTIKSKSDAMMPVSLYGLNKKKVVFKTWIDPIRKKTKVTIPADSIRRLGLNHEGIIPEINRRNNYKAVKTLLNKPLQFRLLTDIEDPRYNQVFFIPEFDFNVYDGISVGPKIYNKTILKRPIDYKVAPKYGFNSNQVNGSAGISYTQFFENSNLNSIRYGISGSTFSFDDDLRYTKYNPFIQFRYRDPYLRANGKQFLTFRWVSVDQDENEENPLEEPNFELFNARYAYIDSNLTSLVGASMDYQLAEDFGKLAVTLNYRKLFVNNRQFNLRFYGGAFLYNSTEGDFFSFALDRPNDYLFSYNYYGRSEEEGLFSQQIVIGEGGFKSQLQPEFANQWITTVNGSATIWNWIFAYGDVGLVKNKGFSPEFVYDSGIRLNLVEDYFELFFPVYSNLGWEIAQDNYDQKIRFIVTLDLQTLTGLFTRRWY
ncbi:hypothetical protein GCM10009117_13310 [Gangjinia marincola]|uniref:Metalloprotease n=1 Tax=Gangjinia marincola TaxID=578463 RepID=A0ABN1MG83_9FLAO